MVYFLGPKQNHRLSKLKLVDVPNFEELVFEESKSGGSWTGAIVESIFIELSTAVLSGNFM